MGISVEDLTTDLETKLGKVDLYTPQVNGISSAYEEKITPLEQQVSTLRQEQNSQYEKLKGNFSISTYVKPLIHGISLSNAYGHHFQDLKTVGMAAAAAEGSALLGAIFTMLPQSGFQIGSVDLYGAAALTGFMGLITAVVTAPLAIREYLLMRRVKKEFERPENFGSGSFTKENRQRLRGLYESLKKVPEVLIGDLPTPAYEWSH